MNDDCHSFTVCLRSLAILFCLTNTLIILSRTEFSSISLAFNIQFIEELELASQLNLIFTMNKNY